jgi:hypothetical protein
LTTKIYTKLASIEINDEILTKIWATNSKSVKNVVKIQKLLLKIGFLEFLVKLFSRNLREKIILNFSRNFREGRDAVYLRPLRPELDGQGVEVRLKSNLFSANKRTT